MIWFDWQMVFWPAVQAWLAGQDPYAVAYFMSPPWLLPIIAPFGLLPVRWGAAAMNLVAVSGLIALSLRLRRPGMALLVGASFVFMAVILDANVEGFVLWGLALGGPVGLLLLSIKPQVAGLVGLVWMIQAWDQERWRGVVKLGLPTLLVVLVFTAAYPQWITAALAARDLPTATSVNGWPWLLPAAAAALIWAVVRRRMTWAAIATTWASPYFLVHSYIGALALVAAESPWLGAAAVAASWVYFFVAWVGV
jgi:hypothetical protein